MRGDCEHERSVSVSSKRRGCSMPWANTTQQKCPVQTSSNQAKARQAPRIAPSPRPLHRNSSIARDFDLPMSSGTAERHCLPCLETSANSPFSYRPPRLRRRRRHHPRIAAHDHRLEELLIHLATDFWLCHRRIARDKMSLPGGMSCETDQDGIGVCLLSLLGSQNSAAVAELYT